MKSRLLLLAVALALAVGGGLYVRAAQRPAADAAVLTQQGVQLEEQNDFEGAAAKYEAALAADDGARQARLRLGLLRFKQAKWEEAAPIMIRAAGENPDDVELLINLGTAMLQLERDQEAVDWLTRAITVAPDSAAAHNNLGVALARISRFDDAAVEFKRTLELNPEHRTAARSLRMVEQQIPAKVR